MTKNHNFTTPKQGAQNWHVPINENFQKLDTDVEIRDSDSNRGNYQPRDGAKFLATDTGRVYLGNGSKWNLLGTIGSDSGGSSGGSVSAERLAGRVVPMASGLTPGDAIDPGSTDTPIQDAINLVDSAGGGTVLLPPTTVQSPGNIRMKSNVNLRGTSIFSSAIHIGDNSADGIVFDANANGGNKVEHMNLGGFRLSGPGLSSRTGIAIHHVQGDTHQVHMDRIAFTGWANSIYKVDRNNSTGPFECRHDNFIVYMCDAGHLGSDSSEALIDWQAWYGPANTWGTMAVYPSSRFSGSNSNIACFKGGTHHIDHFNIGGSSGRVLRQTWDAQVNCDYINYEAIEQVSAPSHIVLAEGDQACLVDKVRVKNAATEYVYEVGYESMQGTSPCRKRIGIADDRGEIRANVLNLTAPADSSRPSFYYGSPDNVDVNHSERSTGGLRALGDAGTPMG